MRVRVCLRACMLGEIDRAKGIKREMQCHEREMRKEKTSRLRLSKRFRWIKERSVAFYNVLLRRYICMYMCA